MVSLGTLLHATGPALPLPHDRAVTILLVGLVVFAGICYLWYRDYHRRKRGDVA